MENEIEKDTEQSTQASTQANRRQFLGLAATAVSGLALSQFAPEALGQNACTAKPSQALVPIGEIVSADGYLQGVIDLTVKERGISYYAAPIFACDTHQLRAYQGYRGFSVAPANAVFSKEQMAVAGPGPTLRVGVGETMEMIFLNRINPALLNNTAVTSKMGKCDTANNSTGGTGPYPGKDADNYPNCFHASNTTNLHWHGTHTSPNAFADNVFLGVLPNSSMNVAAAILQCKQAFAAWNAGKDPTASLIAAAKANLNSMYQAALASKNDTLAVQLKAAIDNNAHNMGATPPEFPQFWPGVIPYHVPLPKWSGSLTEYPRMGQSPGTHWYHCHQHGSTSLQLLNGMAGAVIITDNSPTGYDGMLSKLGYKEQVLVMQLFSEQPNQLNASPSAAQVAVNGQMVPTISMKQGEVQWWRVVNACMQAHGIQSFLMVDETTFNTYVANAGKPEGKLVGGKLPTIPAGTDASLNQCAQDGVQFVWSNYQAALNQPNFQMAPGNRSDFLVQAPKKAGSSYLVFWPAVGRTANDIRANTLLQVIVTADTSTQQLPTQAQFPVQPGFLADITAAEVHGKHQEVDFSMTGGPGTQPFFYIDGKQFTEGVIDHSMQKDTAEEWLLTNTSLNAISHPYHIHINPFQVIEVYDPATMTPAGQKPDPVRDAKKLPGPWIWWDVISVPAGVSSTDAAGKAIVVPGHLRIRSRFVDFIGKYVLHCHILGHEDRGMMEMVQVVDNHTAVKHH